MGNLPQLFMIKSCSFNKAKNDSIFCRLNINIPDEGVSYDDVKIWQETWERKGSKNEVEEMLRPGKIIEIHQENLCEGIIKDFRPTMLMLEIGLPKTKIEELFSEINNYLHKITNDNLRNFIKKLLCDYSIEFQNSPAAQRFHHNYRGGLLQHTYECLHIAEILLNEFQKTDIDKNVVIAACILHDLAKIWEYQDNEDKNFEDKWISHSQWGYSVCMCEAEKLNDNDFFIVAKMIATHHARSEWGAIIDLDTKGLEPIYYILHHIDDLSAKFGKTSLEDVINISEEFKNLREQYYKEQEKTKQFYDTPPF